MAACRYDTKQGKWQAVRDMCPHRLAPLSEGRVDEHGHIQCPQISSFGNVNAFRSTAALNKAVKQALHLPVSTAVGVATIASVPQMEKGVLPPATASCVKSYPTVVKQGLIWVWMHPGVSPNPDEISTFDPIDQPGVIHMDFQSVIDVPIQALTNTNFLHHGLYTHSIYDRDVPYDYTTLLENVLDASHLPYTHHKTLSNRDQAKPIPAAVTQAVSLEGFGGTSSADGMRTVDFSAPVRMHNKVEN
eukprot:13199-Heterococcus_DN1.PRE.2